MLRLRYCGELQVDITMGDADECVALDDATFIMLVVSGGLDPLGWEKSGGLLRMCNRRNSWGWRSLSLQTLEG